ncbi:unnamed protein product [Parajaminaea phylloscopi]
MVAKTSEATTERRTSSRIAAQPAKPAPAAASKPASAKRKAEGSGQAKDAAKKSTSDKEANGAAAKAEDAGKAQPAAKADEKEASASKDTLKVGDALPDALQLKDEEGNIVHVGQLKKTVIFLYPKANTPGCTAQACLYRDKYSDWKEVGYDVFGLSNDNETPLKNWKKKENFPYRLLSDPSRALIKQLTGVASKTVRSHVVIDSEGKLADIKIGVKPAESSGQALAVAKEAK